MNKSIRIVVAEDDFFTLEGICSLLANEQDFDIVGRARNGEEAIRLVRDRCPDVLLLDIRMPPGIDGLEVIRRLRMAALSVTIITLTQEFRSIKAVQEAGADGYLPKDEHHMFIPTIRCVATAGSEVFVNPKVSRTFQELQDRVEAASLNAIEQAVWRLMGYKNEEIARRLHKSPGRIRNVISDLYFKLDIADQDMVSRRVQAMEYARILGFLVNPECE